SAKDEALKRLAESPASVKGPAASWINPAAKSAKVPTAISTSTVDWPPRASRLRNPAIAVDGEGRRPVRARQGDGARRSRRAGVAAEFHVAAAAERQGRQRHVVRQAERFDRFGGGREGVPAEEVILRGRQGAAIRIRQMNSPAVAEIAGKGLG